MRCDVQGEERKWHLVLYAIVVVGIMYISYFSSRYIADKRISYFGPYGLYFILLFIGYRIFGTQKQRSEPIDHIGDYGILAFLPVVATCLVAFIPIVSKMRLSLLLIVVVYSVLNGTLEELFWRGTFNRMYGQNILLAYVVPTIIFTAWHFALLLCKSMSYHGGAMALVGGAAFMGAIWGYVMFRTKKVELTIAAHILVNICAFSELLYSNF